MPAWWDYARLVGFFYSGCSNGHFSKHGQQAGCLFLSLSMIRGLSGLSA